MEKDEGPPAVATPGSPARYIVLTVTTPVDAAEAVAALFWEARTRGVVWEDGPQANVTLRAYLPMTAVGEGALEAIRGRLAVLPRFGLTASAPALVTAEITDEAWASAWKEHFRPFRVGRRILIVPSWEIPAPGPGDVVIRLDPGMAFGSGLHASTQLCLALLEERLRPGETVADIGTGSGILAIAAARLGAARVVAVDDDPLAVSVAAANAASNGVAGRVRVTAGHLLDPLDRGADLLLANLTADVLEEMAAAVPARLRPGGVIVASGIIAAGLEAVRGAFERAGLVVLETRAQEEWRALVARRPPDPVPTSLRDPVPTSLLDPVPTSL